MTVIEHLKRQGVNVQRLCLDSRRVMPGDVFVAIKGARDDGRAFINDAVERGAAAVLHEAGHAPDVNVPSVAVSNLGPLLGQIAHLVYGRPSEKMQVVGVTGTNGKTSVSQWIAQALNGLGKTCAVVGTLGNGFPGQLKESPNTTPDAVAVHGSLAQFLAQGASACAMEVSSIGLDQGRVNGVAFDTAVFTNLSRDHLDYHGDMDAYAAAKATLFEMPGLTTAVLNLDDPFGIALAEHLHDDVFTIGYTLGAAQGADDIIAAHDLRMTATGMEFNVNGSSVKANVIGRFNASNLLAVMGTLKAMKFSVAQAATVMQSLVPPPGRLQTIGGINSPLAVVDYAHSPDALDKTLTALREVSMARGGKLICLFGCGGDRDAGKRPMMGAIAERLADQVIITSDNPRSEDPEAIASQILAGMKSKPLLELDRDRAISDAIANAGARDVLLLAGKGHEMYQEIAGVKRPFSDVDSARHAMESRE